VRISPGNMPSPLFCCGKPRNAALLVSRGNRLLNIAALAGSLTWAPFYATKSGGEQKWKIHDESDLFAYGKREDEKGIDSLNE
jgi:hypothetical protein